MKLFEAANSVDFVAYTEIFHSFTWYKKGGGLWTVCPFHGDSNASYSFNKRTNKGKCFSCGAGAHSLVDFIAAYMQIEPKDAAKLIVSDMGLSYDENTSQGRMQ